MNNKYPTLLLRRYFDDNTAIIIHQFTLEITETTFQEHSGLFETSCVWLSRCYVGYEFYELQTNIKSLQLYDDYGLEELDNMPEVSAIESYCKKNQEADTYESETFDSIIVLKTFGSIREKMGKDLEYVHKLYWEYGDELFLYIQEVTRVSYLQYDEKMYLIKEKLSDIEFVKSLPTLRQRLISLLKN